MSHRISPLLTLIIFLFSYNREHHEPWSTFGILGLFGASLYVIDKHYFNITTVCSFLSHLFSIVISLFTSRSVLVHQCYQHFDQMVMLLL